MFHGQAGAIRRLIDELTREPFGHEPRSVIGTGGFARLLMAEGLSDEVVPELVLLGLKQADDLNRRE